ncbi:hypothetical protein D9758_007492 [Tetrapyrgos nigripes]|uniref:SH3 domain-containing protein n=1 Tax=Tetrapyrgos nigripes TaxID=182062 RepID=A0A8H5G3A6_9AGAR|nr:hypothetical protein D9758_007492 [Tetrapyrgos nigripes]
MVFSNLPHSEKDAFFSLLDEYFESRPELASALKNANTSSSPSTGSGSGGIDTGHVAGRVAAAASAFNKPSRTYGAKPAPGGLVTSQRFGDVDTSSKKSMVTSSLFSKHQQPTAPAVPTSSFAARKNNFVPPVHQKEPEPEPEEEEEEEEAQGEWAEALYDYDPADANDLQIRAKQQIWVTERTSDDWWTGQVDGTGKAGLFPATYVKLL